MKKLINFLPLLLIFATPGCTKESASADFGSWTLGTSTYKVAFSTRTTVSGGSTSTMLIFADVSLAGGAASANTLNFSFKNAPTASGTFQVVGVGASTNNNQVEIATGGPGGYYAFIGTTPVNMDVTVSNGKISITVPNITLKSTTGQPDVTLSGSVKEM